MVSFDFLRNEIVGNDFYFNTPYGKILMTYADYTASGKTLRFIENYIFNLQRSYANSHTEDDVTGRTMTQLIHKSEKIIKEMFNAGDNSYIIANGTGATGAIEKIQQILGIYMPPATKKRIRNILNDYSKNDIEKESFIKEMYEYINKNKPVVFIGPYEHHSNDIMWREGICEVIEVNLSKEGFLDLEDLEKKVSDKKYENRYKIGSFSAASNVTGTISPIYDISGIMHKHNAIALFDYAASAPYVEINMNKDNESYLDAVFISPHKFLGGPGSSGILVLNEKLYDKSLSPTFAAGGTVDYVSSFAYDFTKDVEAREKPGTPGVLQVIKAALSIQLKKEIGIDKIEEKEYEYTKRALERLSKHPNIEILGTKDPKKRVSIFSMIIKHKDRYLHPKLATVLLNDLFGVQSRAGCSCAGPYGHKLLSIDKERSTKFRDAILKGYCCVKPGWLRVNFHYVMNEDDFNFVCDTIEFIADYGYLFINQYKMNLHDGSWIHKNYKEDEYLTKNFGISDIINNYDNSNTIRNSEINREAEYKKYMSEALKIVEKLKKDKIENYKTTGIKVVDELSTFYFSEVY